jgi:hypothetical protein
VARIEPKQPVSFGVERWPEGRRAAQVVHPLLKKENNFAISLFFF